MILIIRIKYAYYTLSLVQKRLSFLLLFLLGKNENFLVTSVVIFQK